MKVIVAKNYDEVSKISADIVIDVVKNNKKAVLGLATGSSPIGMYEYMVKDHKENGTSYKNVVSVNLDEYVGLNAYHDQSYAYFMNYHLFSKVDICKGNTHLPNGMAKDKQAECDRYNALLKEYARDIQVLGIGSNGHIGFNEPGTPFTAVTHVVDLTENTIKDNSRLFEKIEDVPKQAFSMGIENIMQSKNVLVIACGKNKAQAVKGMIEGSVTELLPASVLQKHPSVTVVLDEDAASLLSKK